MQLTSLLSTYTLIHMFVFRHLLDSTGFLQAYPMLGSAGLWMDFSATICGLVLGTISGTPVLFPKHWYTGKIWLPELSVGPDPI